MSGTWLLIWMMAFGYGGLSGSTEFSSQEKCEAAAKLVKEKFSSPHYLIVCVKR